MEAVVHAVSSIQLNSRIDAQTTQNPAIDVNISGGSFVHVEGDYNNSPPTSDERGLQTLLQGIAREAMHDSAERYPPPMCHPNTRVEIQKAIQMWMDDLDTPYPVFWLYAPVGEGKSAIMQSIAQLFSSPDGDVAATFFFGRGKGKREDGKYLFSTLAYQLALNVPGLRVHIDEIMRSNPTLPSASMDVQAQSLIADAFAKLEASGRPRSVIILIDGLDECQDDDVQQSILQVIGQLLTNHSHDLPLRFLIASRPEQHIREIFNGPILREITYSATIIYDYTSSHASQNDIENFLRDRFADIYRRKSHLIGKLQAQTWPSDEIVQCLSAKASGQFIYATTVLKFVDDKFSRPGKQLQIILSAKHSGKNAFSGLDSLYFHILSTYPDFENLTRVLGFIVGISKTVTIGAYDYVLEDLLEFERGEIGLILQGLHSLLRFEGNGSAIYFNHASFHDFLLDQNRSGRYYIDKTKYEIQIVIATFSLLSSFILDSVAGRPTRSFSQLTVDSIHCGLHLTLIDLTSLPTCLLDDVAKIEEELRAKDLRKDVAVPFGAFFAIDLLITTSANIVKANAVVRNSTVREYLHALSHLNLRYNRLLYQFYDHILSSKGPYSGFFEILATQDGLSAHTLADLFMVNLYQIPTSEPSSTEQIEGEVYGDYMWPDNSAALLAKSFDILGTMDLSLEANRRLCKRVQNQHLNLCCGFVSRFFDANWADTFNPQFGLYKYIQDHFDYHLIGLTLDPSDEACATKFLEVLDDLEIRYPDEMAGLWASTITLRCIWSLLKSILSWLAKMENPNKVLSPPFRTRVRSIFDQLIGQIFCVARSGPLGPNMITICEPFLMLEQRHQPRMTWPWISSIRIDQVIEEGETPVGISDDIFLLDFIGLNLDMYFTDPDRAGDVSTRRGILSLHFGAPSRSGKRRSSYV